MVVPSTIVICSQVQLFDLAQIPSTAGEIFVSWLTSQVQLFVPKYSYLFPSTAKDRFCSADFPSTARDQFSWADFPSTAVKPQVQTQWMFVLIFLGNMLKIWTFPKTLFMTVFSFRSLYPKFYFLQVPSNSDLGSAMRTQNRDQRISA